MAQRGMQTSELNQLTQAVIGAAMEVHRALGPGLLESAYRKCLRRELTVRGIPFEYERALPLEYKGIHLECGYRLDLLKSRAQSSSKSNQSKPSRPSTKRSF